jgi:glycine oxidase
MTERNLARGTVAPDLVVIGGGVIGLAIAWRAANEGARTTVVDASPGSGASAVAAGMLAPVTEVHPGEEALLRLNLMSSRLYPAWVKELEEASDRDVGYRRCGTLMVARDGDENRALEEVLALQQRLDVPGQRLTGSEARELEPVLSRKVRGGIHVPDDHAIDGQALTAALMTACERAGVTFVPQSVKAIGSIGDRVAGVRLDDGGTIGCDGVVLSAGCWSGRIEGVPAEIAGVLRPVKGQLLRLRAGEGTLPFDRNLRGSEVYLVARTDGSVIVGATVEEKGFDTAVTADAVYELLRDAYEIAPSLLEARFDSAVAGLRPGTPDNAPLIGNTSLGGLFVACGHYRNGLLLAPVTARAIVALLSGAHDPAVDDFSPDRFERSMVAR